MHFSKYILSLLFVVICMYVYIMFPRDIPMPLVSSGVEHGNLRELALARMKDLGTQVALLYMYNTNTSITFRKSFTMQNCLLYNILYM